MLGMMETKKGRLFFDPANVFSVRESFNFLQIFLFSKLGLYVSCWRRLLAGESPFALGEGVGLFVSFPVVCVGRGPAAWSFPFALATTCSSLSPFSPTAQAAGQKLSGNGG